MFLTGCLLVVATAWAQGQNSFAPAGTEYNIAGTLPGEQNFPHSSITTNGGYLVWQDNITDGDEYGISARKLDSSLSVGSSAFRVNVNGADWQERPHVSLLNDGGAVFLWQGGKQSFQHIYARVLSAAGEWVTGDVQVNTATNVFQLESALTTLANGNVVVVWSTFDQVAVGSLRDVYSQILTPAGAKIGGETLVNQATALNQRAASVAALSDGRYLVVWISEQQRFDNVVDVYGRVYSATGVPVAGEFLINASTNICDLPSVAASADGGFTVAWQEWNGTTLSNGWDIFARPISVATSGQVFLGQARQVNTYLAGDQVAPKISALGSSYLVVWTSSLQDGSGNGVFGQYLNADGSLLGGEFRVNTTTVSHQVNPCVASDGVATFLTVWSSFVGGSAITDLFAQRYVKTDLPLAAPGAPIVTVLSSNSLSVSWPPVQGYNLLNYQVYADGSATATAVVTNTYWNATGLAPSSTHSYRFAYGLTDGRHSLLSGSASNTTYSALWYYNLIPQEWMDASFTPGNHAFWTWPSPYVDSDGDGASNYDEFLAGTDPMDANSVLKVRLQPTAQGLFLNWNTQVGLMYQVQTAPVPGGSWTNLGGPRFAAGTVDSMYVGSGSTGFYRIVRLR